MEIQDLGVRPTEILLPRADLDPQKWSVVACDQYTSEPEYWEAAANFIADAPSTLNLVFPEVYLEQDETAKNARITKINATMRQYLADGIFSATPSALIYLNRATAAHPSRQGLMLTVDLEKYDYRPGSQTLIRATEGTVLDRIPPRLKIRADAPLELPHIMLLIDDPEHSVIEPLAAQTSDFKKVYDFDMMLDSGHLTGWQIDSPTTIENIFQKLAALIEPEKYAAKYGLSAAGAGAKNASATSVPTAAATNDQLLFATGDGNHSLATAKAHWENIKTGLTAEQQENHPARRALVEVVNIHDAGLEFEPIHRVVFNTDLAEISTALEKYATLNNLPMKLENFDSRDALNTWLETHKTPSGQAVPLQASDAWAIAYFPTPVQQLAVGTWQNFLDWWVKENSTIKLDYVHDDASVDKLCRQGNNVGCYLPAMRKEQLFKTVIMDGALPRKTFSMGSASEKRFYLEARKIQ